MGRARALLTEWCRRTVLALEPVLFVAIGVYCIAVTIGWCLIGIMIAIWWPGR